MDWLYSSQEILSIWAYMQYFLRIQNFTNPPPKKFAGQEVGQV